MERFFHEELEQVRSNLILMGRKSVDIVRLAVRALIENDSSLVGEVIMADDELDELNKSIDSECIRYITLRSPVASDVRLITVAMKCSRELERTGDEAVSIAKRARRISNKGVFQDYFNVPRMAELALLHLNESLDAFVEENTGLAHGLPQRDKEIDRLNRDNYEQLNHFIVNNKEQSQAAVDMMFISKSLERVGDHASNIAEEVVYLLEGKDIRHTHETKRGQED